MMEVEIIAATFKMLAEVAKAVISEKPAKERASTGKLSPDMMEQYNHVADQLIAIHPDVPLTIFKNIDNPTQANYPKAIEVLGQIKVGLAVLENELVPSSDTTTAKSKKRPRVFIGCSVEGLPAAKLIQLNLSHSANTDLWSQGVFGLSSGTLETLTNKAAEYDYAILVLTPDDLLIKREDVQLSARDNVLFELGLFMGTLGRSNTFIVAEEKVSMPSDLAGITPARYSLEGKDNPVAELGPVCTKIELEMGTL